MRKSNTSPVTKNLVQGGGESERVGFFMSFLRPYLTFQQTPVCWQIIKKKQQKKLYRLISFTE